MKTILTLKYGTKYSAKDVNSIYYCTEGKYNYICVTDDPKDLHPDIGIVYMEHEPAGNMEKLKLFQIKASEGETILYLDLDVSFLYFYIFEQQCKERHLYFLLVVSSFHY